MFVEGKGKGERQHNTASKPQAKFANDNESADFQHPQTMAGT